MINSLNQIYSLTSAPEGGLLARSDARAVPRDETPDLTSPHDAGNPSLNATAPGSASGLTRMAARFGGPYWSRKQLSARSATLLGGYGCNRLKASTFPAPAIGVD
jgi:hypothetical protein